MNEVEKWPNCPLDNSLSIHSRDPSMVLLAVAPLDCRALGPDLDLKSTWKEKVRKR